MPLELQSAVIAISWARLQLHLVAGIKVPTSHRQCIRVHRLLVYKGLCSTHTHVMTSSPRDEALLITRQRPKGLKVVSYPKFSINSENPFLGGQSLRVLGEK